jgi:ribosomal protein L40E
MTRFICKQCGAESPAGIGYALAPGQEPDRAEPDPGCPGPHADRPEPCTSCGVPTGMLERFPGGVCLSCWAKSPDGRRMPTADELTAMWGGKTRKGRR